MLHNHGWEKQQTMDQRGQADKETLPCVKRIVSNLFVYGQQKQQPKLNYKNYKRIIS